MLETYLDFEISQGVVDEEQKASLPFNSLDA